jgi:hypothetical protein
MIKQPYLKSAELNLIECEIVLYEIISLRWGQKIQKIFFLNRSIIVQMKMNRKQLIQLPLNVVSIVETLNVLMYL